MNFIFTYQPAWLILILVLAAVASFWLYYRAKEWSELSKTWLWALGVFRFLSLSLIGFLLLGLILENFTSKTQKPIVFLLHDQSESVIQTADSTFYKGQYVADLNSLEKKLKENFEVVSYGFSGELKSGIDSNYNQKLTDISQGLEQVYSQYENRNIGAIILSSDGIFNTGQNPIYTVGRKANVPVFTIGLGDTLARKDLFISEVINNDVAFLGNDFPVEVGIAHAGFKNAAVKVDLLSGGAIVQSKKIQFTAEQTDAVASFQLNAKRIGYQKYTVQVTQLEGEFTYKNNSQNFYVNVIDGRQKILLTYTYTHPDIGALNYVIENNKNYDLTVKPIDEVKEKLTGYDLIIAHNYQSNSPTLNSIISTNEVPVLHIVGVNADFRSLVNANIGLSGNGNNSEDITFAANPNFKDILFDAKVTKMLSDAPPLTSPQGNISFSEGVQAIAFQKIGSITLSKPLIYANQKGDNKYAVILGEGIWRWRLFDQMQNETTENFASFFSQMITYLAVKENKDPFKINIGKEFEESDEVTVRAELYNASYQLTNEAEVKFKLIDDQGKVFDYAFFKTNESYLLELGKLKQGIYNWEANTVLDQKAYAKKGTFVVRETKREMLNLTANHRLLNTISANTRGQFFAPNQLAGLETELMNRDDIVSITYQEKNFDDLIDYKWLFFVVFALLAVEWFVRKFQGGY